jgi:hypothetical protein
MTLKDADAANARFLRQWLRQQGLTPLRDPRHTPDLFQVWRWKEHLSPMQGRVVAALVADGRCPTRREVADELGVSLGTVHTHLLRVARGHPDVWAEVCRVRALQKQDRHQAAVYRERERSRRWHARKANRRFHAMYGRYPWEPRRAGA